MLVKDIILKACDFTENDELAKAIGGEIEYSVDLQEVQNKMLKCFNLVRNEIASEFIPLRKIEKLKSEGTKICFNKFSSKVCDIVSVKNNLGENIGFDVFDDYLSLYKSDIEVEVCYNALPDELTFEGEFSSVLPERVYAYGVVREYYFLQTLYEDAKIWDERFKNSLQALQRKKGDTVLPRRRWI